MDTDSFIIHATGTADEPATLDFGDLMDANILGKFKDELQGSDNVSIPMVEVVALRVKTYSVRTGTSKSCILKNKGVPGKATIVTPTSEGMEAVQEEVVEKISLSHQHFLNALAGRAVPPIE